jgi:hypothetical protein
MSVLGLSSMIATEASIFKLFTLKFNVWDVCYLVDKRQDLCVIIHPFIAKQRLNKLSDSDVEAEAHST